MKVRAIVNPHAGRGARRRLERALAEGRPSWQKIDVRLSSLPGEGRDIARDAAEKGYDAVLSVGGDGTANEIASGLLGSETALGIVPMGSGNGLGRTMGIPLDPRLALQALETATGRRMDVGWINGRPFLNVAGVGFDGIVASAFNDSSRGGGRGLGRYISIGLKKALTYRGARVEVRAGEKRLEANALLVAFVNGRQYGGGAVVSPSASLDDGLLNVVVLEMASLPKLVRQLPRLFGGSIASFSGYHEIVAAGAEVVSAQALAHHRDGESGAEEKRFEVRVEPSRLKVLVPEKTCRDPTGPFRTSSAYHPV